MSDIVMAEPTNRATENLKKKPPKGILKASSSFEINDTPQASRKPAHRSPKGTKWDEMNILQTLHPADKDYGHMKIEEPKTPYERRPVMDDEVDGVDPGVLAERIQASASQPPKALVSSEEESDDDAAPEDVARKKIFESKRKAHYNEFLMAKRAMKELAESDEDDEEDEDTKKPIVVVDDESSRPNGVPISEGPRNAEELKQLCECHICKLPSSRGRETRRNHSRRRQLSSRGRKYPSKENKGTDRAVDGTQEPNEELLTLANKFCKCHICKLPDSKAWEKRRRLSNNHPGSKPGSRKSPSKVNKNNK